MRKPLTAGEIWCAKKAERVVREAGGYLSFDDYDAAIRNDTLFAPITWCQGWGDRNLMRHNNGVLAAHAAVIEGYLEQTQTGYRVTHEGSV